MESRKLNNEERSTIRSLVGKSPVTYVEIASAMGISQSHISNVLSGNRGLSLKNQASLYLALGRPNSLDWEEEVELAIERYPNVGEVQSLIDSSESTPYLTSYQQIIRGYSNLLYHKSKYMPTQGIKRIIKGLENLIEEADKLIQE